MSQVRGSCGHLKASWDNHPRCFACSRCSFQSRCQICKLWPSSIWTLASNRRSYVQRKFAVDKKKMGKKGASSRDTVSKTVEGSNGSCQPGSGTVSRQYQSENSSQSKSASGENYREKRENLLTDTSRSTEATPVDRIGGSTTNVSADKRIDRSSDQVSRVDSSSSGRDSSESDRSPGRVSPVWSSQPQSKDRSLQHRSPDRSSRHRSPDLSSQHRSQDRASLHQSPGRSSRHRSPGRSSRHRSPGRTYLSRSCHRSYSQDRHSSSRRHRSKIKHKYSRSKCQRHHRYTSPSSYGSSSKSRSESVSSEWSTSSDRNRHLKRKKSHRRRSISTYRTTRGISTPLALAIEVVQDLHLEIVVTRLCLKDLILSLTEKMISQL